MEFVNSVWPTSVQWQLLAIINNCAGGTVLWPVTVSEDYLILESVSL
jgi:hypothetical protein